MKPKHLVILFTFVLLLRVVPSSEATVEPSLENMVKWSDAIVVATISAVDNPGASNRVITARTITVLKGKGDSSLKEHFDFHYRSDVQFNFDFAKYAQQKTEQILFLKRFSPSTTNEYQLTDPWFGVKPASTDLIDSIEKILINGS